MARNRGSRKKHPQGTTSDKPLAKELFPELNATFYTADPAGFLRLRIEALSLMALSREQLREVYAAERRIGSLGMTPSNPPDDDERERYIATEAEMIIHHAVEMILRMFFAHVEAPDCPWLDMASSTSFADFKRKVDKALTHGFDRDDIAIVFFGGENPRDAAIRATDEEFQDAVEAVRQLLLYSAHLLLSESFLYNAAKHGLTTVQLDDSTKMTLETEVDEIQIHAGRMLTYLHKPATPNAPKDDPKWHISMTGAQPDQDLAVATMIYHGLQNLWQVARRRYTAQSGQVILFTTERVESCIYAPITHSQNIIRTITMELTKKNRDGSLTGIGFNLIGNHVPKGWQNPQDAHDSRTVELPVRQRDKKIDYDARRWLLPFSPKNSSRA
ncbi:hypothetical protein BFN03_02600 [Rhodococcus sp. WMMA185]|uniref:hypothetical protein n=1 Tax=Rhodococcus sp. WMMA185 TaxID=679318 RepID=UPI000878C806|nr:hypothetical protein [Rhodococcus sp. WMMA185]AOW91960.1 hypothetical protein BFN03_02600 [Rhodococcus sp. WMMA185]